VYILLCANNPIKEEIMRRLLMVVVVVASFAMVGCLGKGPESPQNQQAQNPCYVGAPQWVLMPEMEGGLAAGGSAKIGPAGLSFAKTEAMAAARDAMARQISVKVKNMFKSFTQTTGVGDEQTVDKVAANVSKQVANQTLSGTKLKNTWISPCNELHVLVVMDPNVAAEATKKKTLTSLRNEKALWQQFLAKKAQNELDQEIEKEFNK